MKEKFSQEEWETLKLIPFGIFYIVAGADSKIEKKEVHALFDNLLDYSSYESKLHRELVLDMNSTSEIFTLFTKAGNLMEKAESWDIGGFVDKAEKMKEFLKEKLTPGEYQEFVKSIFASGIRIAEASIRGFFGFGNKIRKEERKALRSIADVFEVDWENIGFDFTK